MARRTRAKTRITSFTRFTSRKLETWMSSLCPAGASPSRPVGSTGRYSARLTKLGITLRSQLTQPKARYVSSRRYAETAVTTSDRSMENLVMAKKLDSWPTSVMSVPCRVVMTCKSRSPRSISRARKAVVACGMA